MADVSRAGLPSSSSKHIYDGVFISSKVKSTVFASFNDDDYGEIFGCSKSDNGGWQSSSCSIPVVELPVSEQRVRGVRGIEMDYGGVFGGFSDKGLSLMNGDELFDQLKKKARTSPPVVSVSRDKSKEPTKEVTRSHIPTNSRNVEPSMDDISKSSDGFKQNKQKTNDMPLQEVQNSRTPLVVKPVVIADTQFDDDMPIRETHSGNFTNQTNGASHEVDSSHKAPISETPVIISDTEVEVGINVVKPVVKADTQFDGDMPIRKIHSGNFTNQTNGASHEVDSSHNAPISETPVIQSDTEVEVNINVATKGKHPKHSGLDIGVNEHKSDVEFDAENNIRVDGFSNSYPKIHNSETHSRYYQESGLSSSSSALHRHSRMTSLDLGRHVSDHDDDDGGGFRRKSRLGSSYSFDGSHDPSVARVKVQSSKVIPSSSEPHFYHMESRYKISANSKSGIPLPSLDDQLDANSLAAISASALQRAIEEAEMQIRFAKEFLERESRGCTKLRFKDTLKGKVSIMKKNKHVNEINNVKKKKNMVEDHSHVVESVLETTRFVPVVEDHKKFLEESITGENANAPPESIEEGGNNEGGEWEATKHLNQLITGVKNRLASFITWQVETEKKQPHSSEYGGRELKENDENAITTDKKSEIEENLTGVASRRIESEEKVGGLVDSTLDTKGSTSTNFSFFAFNSGRSDTEKKESQTSEEIETEIELKGNEANVEIRDNNSVNPDYGERLINSIFEECIVTMKEHYPMEAHETNQFVHEDDDGSESNREASRAVDVGHRDGRVICEESDEEGAGDKRVIEESEDDGCGSILEAVNEGNEERGSYTDASIHEVDDGTRVNEDCGDDTDTSFHEVDDETTKNEEYASIHKEGYDRRVLEEHGDDRSRSSDEAENIQNLTEEIEIEDIVFIVEDDNDLDEIEVFEESEDQLDDAQLVEKKERASEERSESPVKERDECAMYCSEGVSRQMNEVEEDGGYKSKSDHVEETTKKDAVQASCMEVVDKCWQIEDVVLSKAEESVCRIDGGDVGAETEFAVENGKIIEKNDFSSGVQIRKIMEKNDFASDVENGKIMEKNDFASDVENGKIIEKNDFPYDVEVGVGTPVTHDEEREEKMEITNHSSEPEIGFDHPVLLSHTAIDCIEEKSGLMHAFAENSMKFDGIERHNSIDLECESIVLPECETNVDSEVKADVDDGDTENGVEFDGVEHHNNINAPFPCENSAPHDCDTDVDSVQKVSNDCKESELKSDDISANQTEKCSVEAVHRRRKWFENGETIGVTELVVDDDILVETDSVDDTTEAVREGDSVLNQGEGPVNVETAHKRRRWFVKRGDEGFPDPSSLFEGVKVSSPLHHEVDEVVGGEKDKPNVEATPRRKRWFESVENVDPAKNPSHEDDRTTVEITQDKNRDNAPTLEEKNDVSGKVDPVSEPPREIEEETRRKRDREREKERIAVERAIREARERAFAEAKERAKRDALERPQIRVTCQKSSGGEGNSTEAKIRAERAAVERATAEVRERALQKALSEKASQRSGRYPPERSSSLDPKYSSSSHSKSSDPLNNVDKFDGDDGESAQRRKARLERQNRTMERAAKALDEKNKRDLLVQKEQAAQNILAEALDAEVKRWSTGKEGNVRALLSTLQYILGSDSGWQAISLTDLIAPTAVRKAYKKATLCVHPDKLQQRGATIQQKYICEKVFDLLKDAWSRFNPEER